jgi:hypothetical protein
MRMVLVAIRVVCVAVIFGSGPATSVRADYFDCLESGRCPWWLGCQGDTAMEGGCHLICFDWQNDCNIGGVITPCLVPAGSGSCITGEPDGN